MKIPMKIPIKKQTSILVLALALLSLSACGKKEEGATPIGRDVSANAPIVAWAQASGIVLNGTITDTSLSQDDFQYNVEGLVEAAYASGTLGYVSTNASGGTGVFIGGRVELATGVLSASNPNPNRVDVRGDSKALIKVVDEFAGRPDASGKEVSAMFRPFTAASGYVQGNTANIEFRDSQGNMIALNGTINGQSFYGHIYYLNQVSVSGSPAEGSFREFHVPACQFFRCQ